MTDSLDSIKQLLSQAEDQYSLALASGDWPAMTQAKRDVAKYRRSVGQIIKANLAR